VVALGRFYGSRSAGKPEAVHQNWALNGEAAPAAVPEAGPGDGRAAPTDWDSPVVEDAVGTPGLSEGSLRAVAERVGKTSRAAGPQIDFVDLRVRLHRFLLDKINLRMVDDEHHDELMETIRPLVRGYVRSQNIPISGAELDRLISDITDEMIGLGPIEPLLKDETVADILINTCEQVYVERNGRLEPTLIRFHDEDHLARIINKIVSAVGRRIDESSPLVDARLPDGSRVNVAVRPIAVDGALVSIRKFSRKPLTMDRLVTGRSMTPPMRDLLQIAVKGRASIVVSGGTGSGKTTLLNALSAQISEAERLITIEDAAELQLQQPHVVRMETRPPNFEGVGEIRQRELVKNALRMRPDRIIVGEVRGEEAFDMMQAMNTGHEGSMTTIHANSPRDAISRLEQMIGMAGMPMSQSSIRHQIASAIDVIVQAQRLSDGTRRVVAISEVTGMEGDVVQMQDIFLFHKTGIATDNRVLGYFGATGIRPRLLEAVSALGLVMDAQSLDPTRRFEVEPNEPAR
jgi:pilus assembly protein CpaF